MRSRDEGRKEGRKRWEQLTERDSRDIRGWKTSGTRFDQRERKEVRGMGP